MMMHLLIGIDGDLSQKVRQQELYVPADDDDDDDVEVYVST